MLFHIILAVMVFVSLFSLVLGNNFATLSSSVYVDNSAIVNGSTSTFEITEQTFSFAIDTTALAGAIGILTITIIVIAIAFGIQFLSSGFNPESSRIIILATLYGGIWLTMTNLSYTLIVSVEIFGTLIWLTISIAYVIGAFQVIAGGNNG